MAKTGRKSGYPELLSDTCTEQGLRALQRYLQDPNVSDGDKWKAASPLVVKRTKTEVNMTSSEPVTFLIKWADQ